MMPGQRRDVIVDFTALQGRTLTVRNNAPVPFPAGLSPVPYADPVCPGGTCPADQPQMAQIMRFVVAPAVTTADTSCNPSVAGQCVRPKPMVKLADGIGNISSGCSNRQGKTDCPERVRGRWWSCSRLCEQHPIHGGAVARH